MTATYTLKKYKNNWKNRYQESNLEYYRTKFPTVYNTGNVPMIKFPDTNKANGLTRFVLDMVNWNGGYANRISSMGRMINAYEKQPSGALITTKKYIPGTTNKGTADIHAIIDGKHFSIEIKVGKDRMSEYQHEEMARVRGAGGNYMIVKDPESFCTALDFIIQTS